MLEINKKEDILIPFEIIGKADWKTNAKEIIESYAELWESKWKGPVSPEEITKLETRLGAALPVGLKIFYETFGLADTGEIWRDLDKIIWIKDMWASPYAPNFTEEDQKVVPYLISFNDYFGNGNMFCFHSQTKGIYYFDHDFRPYFTKMFDTFDDYLSNSLIFAQIDLFGENTTQEEVEVWAEEIVSERIGKDIVKKWRY